MDDPSDDLSESVPAPSARVTVRRGAPRAEYDRGTVLSVLDAGHVAHVGVSTPDGPLVLPMAYGHDGTDLFLHGALANHLLGSAEDAEVCVTVTTLEGLVVARSPFHNSMNYHCVVVRGAARRVDGSEKVAALRLISDHVIPNWDAGREPRPDEIRRTSVVAVPLAEASAKIRTGDPVDEPDDLGGPWWAGVVPVRTSLGEPRAATDLEASAVSPPPRS